MRLRGTLLWPLASLAGWADDNPLSAAGAVVTVGALTSLVVPTVVGIGSDRAGGGTMALDGATAEAVAEAALARPAYVVVALVGLSVVALYDG